MRNAKSKELIEKLTKHHKPIEALLARRIKDPFFFKKVREIRSKYEHLISSSYKETLDNLVPTDFLKEVADLAKEINLPKQYEDKLEQYIIRGKILKMVSDFQIVDLKQVMHGPYQDAIDLGLNEQAEKDIRLVDLKSRISEYPIAILIGPNDSARDIKAYVDAMHDNYIKPLQEKYRDQTFTKARMSMPLKYTQEKRDFIYTLRDKTHKQRWKLYEEKYGNEKDYQLPDQTTLNAIMREEEEKRDK